MGELVERAGLGATVAPEDDEGFASACAALLDDWALLARTAERVRRRPRHFAGRRREPVVYCLNHRSRPAPRRHPPRSRWPPTVSTRHPRPARDDLRPRRGGAARVRHLARAFVTGGLIRRATPVLTWWAHLAVLWSFALAKPLFDILADSPEFFVARENTAGDIVIFASGSR